MEPKTTTGLIYAKIISVMQEVSAIAKSNEAIEPGAKFSYRGIDDLANALHPIFKKHGIFILPEVLNHTEESKDFMPKLRVTTVEVKYSFCASDGSSVMVTVRGEAADGEDKGLSKAMSIALKTALTQMFLIPTEEGGGLTPKDAPVQDQRPWLGARQFHAVLLRIVGGEKGLMKKVDMAYRVNGAHAVALREADKKAKIKSGNGNKATKARQ